jgi:flagellar basal body-associated protein FliL
VSKLKIILPIVVLVLGGGVYKFVLAKPSAEAKPKVDGAVYVLPRDFLVNLREGQFAKVNVALVVDEHAAEALAGAEAGTPPEGFGPMPQEAVIRDIVTDTLTGRSARTLRSAKGRERLKRRIKQLLVKHTDVPVNDVLLTDVAVQ